MITGIADFARICREPCTGFDQGLGLAGRAVPDGKIVAGVEQASAHRKSHHAEPEIAEFFGLRPIRLAGRLFNLGHPLSPVLPHWTFV